MGFAKVTRGSYNKAKLKKPRLQDGIEAIKKAAK